MNTPINHPDLDTKELPAGLSVDAVVSRKKAMMANGVLAATAEKFAIQAEQIQVERDAFHMGPDGVKDAQNRGPRHHYPARSAESAADPSTEESSASAANP